MIRVREFWLTDLDRIDPLYGESHAITKRQNLESNSSWTVFDNDEILCCGGILDDGSGVGTAWLCVDKGIEHSHRRISNLLKLCRFTIDSVMCQKKLRRIQATAFTSNAPALMFAYKLGFKAEGLLKYLGPNGEDAVMLACYGEIADVRTE